MKKLFIMAFLLVSLGLSQFASALPLPNGNYTMSCQNCHFNRNFVLSCSCQNNAGFYHRIGLQVCPRCNYIQNINGSLVCTSRTRRHWARHNRKVVVNAGPIYNQGQANYRCPRVCRGYRRWDGQWWTIQNGMTSVCECIR